MSEFQTRRQRSPKNVRNPRTSTDNMYVRSRTITGSISSKVMSAVESASQLKSSRLEAHELHGHRRKVMWLLLATSLASLGLIMLIDSTIVRLQPATMVDERYISSVDAYYDSHLIERLPFVRDYDALRSDLQQSHPEIADINISGEDMFAAHTVAVALRQPIAQWTLGADTFFVDKNGIAYTIADQDLRPIELLRIKDESGLPVESQRVASTSMMQFIGQTVAGIASSPLGAVTEVIIPSGTLKQVDVLLQNRPYRVQLHIDRDPAGQVADVVSAVTFLDSQGITPEYLDVRVEGKAFYR